LADLLILRIAYGNGSDWPVGFDKAMSFVEDIICDWAKVGIKALTRVVDHTAFESSAWRLEFR